MDQVYSLNKFMDQKNALSRKFHEEFPNLNHVFARAPKLISKEDLHIQDLINLQWNRLVNYDIPSDISREEDVDTFWYRLSFICDESIVSLFRMVSKFALNFLCYPLSNSSSERL